MKPKIIIDIHEQQNLLISHRFRKLGIDTEIKPLELGDYILPETIIERKTLPDFFQSLSSGRLEEQLKNMSLLNITKILLIEGDFDLDYDNKKIKLYGDNGISEIFWNPLTFNNKLYSLHRRYGVYIHYTKNLNGTLLYLVGLVKYLYKKRKKIDKVRFKRRFINDEERIKFILESFPRISAILSERILMRYKTLRRFFMALLNNNLDVEGVGEIIKEDLDNLISKKVK